jgi:glycosyltransferase involved in cell wall biosynthesis
MDVMMARPAGRVKQLLRSLASWLAPGGSRRQRLRIHVTRRIRSLLLPRPIANPPPLPDMTRAADVELCLRAFGVTEVDDLAGNADAIFQWLDFHPEAFRRFPLATTPTQRREFAAWLLTHRERFGIKAADILAFLHALQLDPTRGIEALYRRFPEWQIHVPNGLIPERWPLLKSWLTTRYRISDPWLDDATLPADGIEPKNSKGINLLAHFCYPCGLEVAARATRAALLAAGWDVSCRDVPNNDRTDRPERSRWLGLHTYPITIVQLAPERLGVNAYEVAGLARRDGVYRIGYWYWELGDAPRTWARQSDWLDEIWAPTRFVAEALRNVMTIPVHEMLPAVELPESVEMPRATFGLPKNKFLFLFAFDMSSTRQRKNPEGVIAAFQKAFSPTDPVALAIKITRGSEDPAGLSLLMSAAETERIVIIDGVLPRNDAIGLLNCCDAYVSLHRSEGLGLTLVEAMALGKPVIATRYSGNLDFMTDNNSRLIDFEMTTLPHAAATYPRGARWAEPSIDGSAAAMRWVVDHPAEANAMATRGRETVGRLFSLEAAGQRMLTRLREILAMQSVTSKLPKSSR